MGEADSVGLSLLPFAVAATFGLSALALTSFPIVSPQVVEELRLTYSETGGLTAAYMFAYGLFQIPAGILGVRWGSTRVLLGSVVLMIGSALLGTFASDYAGWLLSRLLLGLGGAAVLPVSLHLLTRVLTGRRLVTGISIFVAGWGAGMTLGLLGAAEVLRAFGWRQVMLAAAGLGVVVLALLWWTLGRLGSTLHEEPAGAPEAGGLLPGLATNGRLNLISLINVAGTATVAAVPSWLPLYVTQRFAISAAEASSLLAWMGIGFVVGGWSGGALATRVGWRPVVVGSLAVSALLVAGIPAMNTEWQVVLASAILGCTSMMFPAPVQSLLPAIVPTEETAPAAAYYNTIGWAGAFAASLLFGFLVDWTGLFNVGWFWLALIPWLGVAAAYALPKHLGGHAGIGAP
jgi:predicted MFS family arabinose efflux permease